MYEFKVKWCPVCNQGWVEIVKEFSTGMLFCACSECESYWDNPYNITIKQVNGLIYDKECCNPTEDDIEESGWKDYILR